MSFELVDTHCHLNYDYSPKTTEDHVREAFGAGVKTLITIGTESKTIRDVQLISEKFDNVYHTMGFHPHEAVTITDEDIELLKKAVQHPKCKAVGEIGLAYYYDHSSPEVQKKWQEAQLEVALEADLPVVIHSRDAEADQLEALKKYCNKLKPHKIPGIIHCFTGTKDFGLACIDLGFYISLSGILTFKNAKDLQEAVKVFPLERLLVETDSPYLAPVPMRGKKCEPSMVQYTAMKLAELKGVSLDEVASTTTQNAKAIFRI